MGVLYFYFGPAQQREMIMKKVDVFADEGKVEISIIEEYEKLLNLTFPEEYKSIISSHNALYPLRSNFGFEVNGQKKWADVSFFGYGELTSSEDISRFMAMEGGHQLIIPFGCAANGDYICFDYRENKSIPRVAIMLHDSFDGSGSMSVFDVSGSFVDFMDSLIELE